ncbi:hypothetical protein PR202_gb25992 [Eleusine coracana subsp. coracana]|uniref:Uncharacterized protein n=1 Tax=Eleusine coracana subsp. coracana TaxID=191504 RepID=A0AAV5FQQ1_ELECO|nr:hypothetical protein PR202_gb25992 [Eleusine coracana subsp. coracana]
MIDDSDGLLLYDPRQPATLTACRSLQPDGTPLVDAVATTTAAMGSSSSAIHGSSRQQWHAAPLRFAPARVRDGVPLVNAAAVMSSSSSAIRGSDSVPVLCDSRWPKTGSACRSLTPRHQRRATCSRSTTAMGCLSAPIQGSPGQQCLGLAAARGVRFRSDAFPIAGCSSSRICGSNG